MQLLEIISVAKGQLAAYITPRLQPWDFAGGLIILNEVGGIGSNLMGNHSLLKVLILF